MSILAPKGQEICVADSSQIEARVNAWLWGQEDLLDAFVQADLDPTGPDAYTNFAEQIYYRLITKQDKTERFVGKVCVLGLGYQMGAHIEALPPSTTTTLSTALLAHLSLAAAPASYSSA